MEVDDLQDSSSPSNLQSIETGIQSMGINDEADMLDESCVPTDNSGNQELSESEKAMLQFQKEFDDTTFSRSCLFCKQQFIGNRSLILDHLTDQHHLFLGQADNLVYVNEFLDILENMLSRLQCIFCEKIFKDWPALKEHMRKKMHKRVNPHNKLFDKFYIANYLDLFSSKPGDALQGTGEEKEILVGPKEDTIMCLFCERQFPDFDAVIKHLQLHGFDFKKIKTLSFYEQVKLINYIRQKVQNIECPLCETNFKSKKCLASHITISGHMRLIPKPERWNKPEYFFPTIETDYLLCGLPVDDDSDDMVDETVEVISEDITIPQSSVLIDENLRNELLQN